MDDAATIPDERLELIFTCCHPALALEAQVALTLRMLLHDAREAARLRDGQVVPLDDQDRTLWDTRQIAALYETLARQTGSPIIEMNRAIAVAEIDGPEAGLAILDRLDLDHYRYFHSTRADLLRRAGRHCAAHHAYRRALDLAQTEPEQRFLQDRLAETAPSVPSQPGCANT